MDGRTSWTAPAAPPPPSFSAATRPDLERLTTDDDSSTDSPPASYRRSSLDPASRGVLNGSVGGAFGPFPRSSVYSNGSTPPLRYRDSVASSDVAIDVGPPTLPYDYAMAAPATEEDFYPSKEQLKEARKGMDAQLFWSTENADVDDYLHEPDPEVDRILDRQSRYRTSFARAANTVSLAVVTVTLVGLFAGWPLYRYVIHGKFPMLVPIFGVSGGGINGTGQVPSLPNIRSLVDASTPTSALTRTGFDGETYNLVFSDEFNEDGRTFWPGDDPYWEAVDLHYWATKDFEWYDPDAITTKDGNLEITLTEEPIHNLNFRSGMLQSWNKFCFTGGYIEINVSLPGTPNAQGFWPAAWTMGNLARAGYGSTNDGMWPYSYNTCDVGTMPNQTWANGTGPADAKHSGSKDYGGELSWLIGQRASACTCPGEDHPGPSVTVGRGAPEIDILEAQIASDGVTGSASQSIQIAPFDSGYNYVNTSESVQIVNAVDSIMNTWHGAVYQESMSVNTVTDKTSFNGAGYSTFGFEYDPGPSGRITWAINGSESWQLDASAMGPNSGTQIGQRLVSEEPMSIVLNLAISNAFQEVQWGKIQFPGIYRIDYVRVYQKDGQSIGCDPADHPTSDYINNHMDMYTNANLSSFAQTNYSVPKNSMSATGC